MRRRSSILVGRDDELRVIKENLEAARSGSGTAMFFVGESGVGKSRLAAAAAELAYTADMSLMRGRSSAIGTVMPLRPLAEALLSLLRSHPVDVTALGPYGPILGRLIPDWGQPTNQDSSSLVILAEAVLRLTGLAGRGRGCLMILDDLQDADAETLAVIEYLIDNLDLQPTMLLGTIRPEPCAALTLARSAAQRGQCALFELGRLDKNGLRRVAGSCLGIRPEDIPLPAADLLWTGSAGNPFLIEELTAGMLDSGLLVAGADGWRMADELRAALPTAFARGMAQAVARLSPQTRKLLSVSALLGIRFPLAVVQKATGMSDRDLLNHLHRDPAAQWVSPDDQITDWYAFRHQLTRDSLLALLSPADRAELAQTVVSAVEATYPGLPDEWCQVSATLHVDAGNTTEAGRLFTEAGRRALAQGAANSAVTLLDKAWEMVSGGDATARANTLETLLYALAEAGLVERALSSVGILDRVGGLDTRRRAQLHTRLAWAAAVAGRSTDALAQVETARGLLGPSAAAEDSAPIDVVAAHLALDVPGQEQLNAAEAMARRAATVAEAVPLPVVTCQAWQLLGALVRHRDPDEATKYLERARSVAAEHGLPIWEIHALIRLGNDDALRHGALDRLEQARERASQVGAVTARYQAEASLALHSILFGDYDAADALIEQILAATTRLKLLETIQYVLLLNAILAGHRGRRREMDNALAQFRRWGGDSELHTPRIDGLARTFCALMEEDRPRALDELSRALAAEEEKPTVYHLSGRYGLHLLFRVMSGAADSSEYETVTAAPASRLRWDRHFALFAKAVLLGRSGHHSAATTTVADALRLGEPYGTARHLALRLVSESALADGWGTPVEWLRTAEEHFHHAGVPAVASACRALLRQAGVRVAQRRAGAQAIPPALRSAGVTVREFEVLGLLVGRLSNREIAERLHLSHRTVERHVSSLMIKTGLPNRIALSEFAAAAVPE